MDESMEILSGLMAGGFYEFHGEIFDIPSIKISPVPSEPIPLLVGGHGEPALRRAAVMGDGWLHGGGDLSELPGMVERLHQLREEHGTLDKPFEIHAISIDAYSADGIKRLEEAGVTDVIVGFRYPYHVGPDPEEISTKLSAMRRYAEDVIHKVG